MAWMIPALTATICNSAILAIVYSYLYKKEEKSYLKIWAMSWSLYLLRYVFELLVFQNPITPLFLLSFIFTQASGFLLLYGTYHFISKKMPQWWSYMVIITSAWFLMGYFYDKPFYLYTFPTFMFLGIIYIRTGIKFLKRLDLKGACKTITGVTFILWGIHKMNYPFLRPLPNIAPWGYLLAAVFELTVALGMLIVYFQKAKDDLEIAEENLRQQHEWLRVTLESIGDGVITTDNEGFVGFMNPVAEQLTGFLQRDAIGKHISKIFDIINEHTREPSKVPIEKVVKEGTKVGLANHTILIRKDKREISIADSAAPIKNPQGEVIGVVIVFRDVTNRREIERAREQLAFIVESSHSAIFSMDPQGIIISWNRGAENIYGYKAEEILGQSVYILAPPNKHKEVDQYIKTVFEEQMPLHYETIRIKKDNTKINLSISISPVLDSENRFIGISAISRDITERKRFEDKLRYMSTHDHLTGLYNRTFFDQRIVELKKVKPGSIGIIVCDIDGLKMVNDTLGHEVGDQYIKVTAKVLKKCIRKHDILARFGGDEFAIILTGVDTKELEKISNDIREAVENINSDNFPIPLTVSVGYAVKKDDSNTIDDIIIEADNNMYREKLYHSRSKKNSILNTLVKMLEARDVITKDHAGRTEEIIVKLGKHMGLSQREIEDMRLFATFHDIGKVGIPDSILFKEGPLDEKERTTMQRHSEIGHRIALSSPELAHIADWILMHHEWWDGNGYPLGIKGEDIPLQCRILSVIDAYDAMTKDRPYRKAMSHKEAKDELIRYSGTQFDPHIVRKFLQIINDL